MGTIILNLWKKKITITFFVASWVLDWNNFINVSFHHLNRGHVPVWHQGGKIASSLRGDKRESYRNFYLLEAVSTRN